MLCIRVVQCLCTQCEGELLHLYEVCLPVISVSVVSFDIAGTLKQKVGVALTASTAPPPKIRFDE